MTSYINKMMKIFLIIFFTGYIFCFHALGQTDTIYNVTLDVKNASAKNFIGQLEAQTGLYFYYDADQLDSLQFTISGVNQPIRYILRQAFAGTSFTFAIDNQKHVFISKDKTLNLTVSADFLLKEKETVKRNNDDPNIAIDKTENKPKSKSKPGETGILENKLYDVGEKSSNNPPGPVTIAGNITDIKTGEPVVGASVIVQALGIGVTTDQYGYYSLSLPRGRHILSIQSLGMTDTRRQIALNGNGKFNIELKSTVISLKGVVISAQKLTNVKGVQMGVQKIDIKTIKQVPVAFGEADILKVVTTLPGVKTIGEASTGLNVRGGAADQNLILYNEATLYNPAHFFGMFSALNPEVVKDVELFKSSIPVKYGGRLSSVLNMNSREGNKKEITGSAGIGPLTSRLQIEGPLIKDKASFIVAGRTTYADWLLKLLPENLENSEASFYDLNLNLNYEIDKKNSVYLTAYMSNDRFNLNSDTLFGYGNKNISAKWKHIFNNKLNNITTAGYDRYEYYTKSEALPQAAYKLKFDINQYYFRTHFNYYLNNQHSFDFGFNTLYYKLHPGSLQPVGSESLVLPDVLPSEQALESALYVSDKYNYKSFFIEGGIRLSIFNYLGPQSINQYPPGVPKTESTITGTEQYKSGAIIKTYAGPEFRISTRYAFNDSFSIKASYNTQRQYIHSISNTAAIAPTDIWKLSDPNIKPQFGNQVSLGLYKNFKSNTIETSVEVYYKTMKDYLDFKSGANLILNPHLETDVIGTKGKAYGVELLIRKNTGKFNGWISYTWSRTLLKMDDPLAGEIINNGNWYPASYDKPHDVTLISNYRFTHRFSLSFNATYSTGRPITLPIGVFYFAGAQRTLYADRNAYRIPDYFRCDFSMNIDGNHKVNQLFHTSWTFGVYNLTGRNNPYSVYYVSENGYINGYKLSIFGSAIPYINFNIRFK
jgi:hypothetical protein